MCILTVYFRMYILQPLLPTCNSVYAVAAISNQLYEPNVILLYKLNVTIESLIDDSVLFQYPPLNLIKGVGQVPEVTISINLLSLIRDLKQEINFNQQSVANFAKIYFPAIFLCTRILLSLSGTSNWYRINYVFLYARISFLSIL